MTPLFSTQRTSNVCAEPGCLTNWGDERQPGDTCGQEIWKRGGQYRCPGTVKAARLVWVEEP